MDHKTVKHTRTKRVLRVGGYGAVLLSFTFSLLFFAGAAAGEKSTSGASPEKTIPKSLPINKPAQITFRTDPILSAAASEDGLRLVYVLERQGLSQLWLQSADPSKGAPPETLAHGGGRVWDPAISRDGSLLAFVGASHDAKGDIFLIRPNSADPGPQRLTGRETADGGPAFSHDGRTLYFHQSRPGERSRQLIALDLTDPATPARALKTGGDAAFPAPSPDGTQCAFVSLRNGGTEELFVLSLKTGKVVPVTSGDARHLSPKWSQNGDFLYFTRYAEKTGDQNRAAFSPNPEIFRVKPFQENASSYPVTSGAFSAFSPMPSAENLYFLSTQKGATNIWRLPLEGEIPLLQDGKSQLALAEALASRIPLNFPLTVSAFYTVLETATGAPTLCEKAAYQIGRLYEQAGEREKAVQAYTLAAENFSGKAVESRLGRIRSVALQARIHWRQAASERERRKIIQDALDRLKGLEQEFSNNSEQASVAARSRIEQARILIDLVNSATSLVEAVELLDSVIAWKDAPRSEQAEALFLKAEVFSRIGRGKALLPAYIKVMEEFPDVEEWSDKAVQSALNLSLAGPNTENREGRIRLLAGIAREYREKLPQLAIGAWNRMGDLYFDAGEWAGAKAAYRQVLEQFPESAAQTAAARLALAEILYREELFSEALALYENEMAARTYQDRIYELAKEGYVRKSLAAADFLYHLGEVPAAQTLYADLMRRDDGLLQAHRGYIKCVAARKQMEKVRKEYDDRVLKNPKDVIGLYGLGLCLTYNEDKASLAKAQEWIRKAIAINGQTAYFHQTSGYISEVMETVYGVPGGLETALASYKKAYFLNDGEKDPANGANLSLNLGNIYFLLGQFSDAFRYYSRRLESGAPFDGEEMEILFYRRLGEAAFQIHEPGQAVSAYQKTLALIEKRVDPRRASEIAGKINRDIFDRVLTPALKQPGLAEKAESLALRQTEIHRRLFDAAEGMTGLPPDPKWDIYKQKMTSILSDQEKIIQELTPLLQENALETVQDLLYRTQKAVEALRFPKNLIQMKAEMLDRLGLALQEEKRWREAREAFEQVYALNEGLGLVRNLAVNRRSMAYCAYMEAETLPGKERKAMLEKAAEGFEQVTALARKYGVPNKKEDRKEAKEESARGGLVSLDLDMALDNVASTKAAYGFSREQEERLAEAFIARIHTELGLLKPAASAIEAQLGRYAENVPISDGDLFGVALLQHRAGHLAWAEREPAEAFDRFSRSARLSIRMKNPVSAAMNVVNMAQALAALPEESSDRLNYASRLTLLDKETTNLLDRFALVLNPLVIPSYHNTLGVRYLSFLPPENAPSSITSAVEREKTLQKAAVHFARGLQDMEATPVFRDRNALALLTALYLNIAKMAMHWQEPDAAQSFFEKALTTSRDGLLLSFEWRALAGLEKLDEALAVLQRAPLIGAECGPEEITKTFSPLVHDLITQEKAEEAFNLLERLSEIERVHRLQWLATGAITAKEKELLQRTFPRLMEIKRLEGELRNEGKKDTSYLGERLSQEREIVSREMGKDWEQVPFLARISPSAKIREWFVILLGMAFHGETLADRAVEKGPGEEKEQLRLQYENVTKGFQKAFAQARAKASQGSEKGILCLLGPDPIEAIDLMDNLPEGGVCFRVIPNNQANAERKAFAVTMDGLETTPFPSDQVLSNNASGAFVAVALEDPLDSAERTVQPVALSATHLVRSIRNRKPFKRHILAIPPLSGVSDYYAAKGLLESADDQQIADAVYGENILLFNLPVYRAGAVPTRPEEIPLLFQAMELDQGRAFPLLHLSGRIEQVSLVMLPDAAVQDAYVLGHLFSLLGVPTLLLPADAGNGPPLVNPFLNAFEKTSAMEAIRLSRAATAIGGKPNASSPAEGAADWMLLGYWGMTPEEATAFAGKHFAQYVKSGVAAFNDKNPLKALALFENALNIAAEITAFKQHIPRLHEYSRESAYGAELLSRADDHARKLVEILADEKPDSQAYAQAQIKRGLILARMEQFEQAIPALEDGLEIVEALELEDEQISALNDLAIVLENATDYDKALLQFQSAAALSRKEGKQGILAKQYSRIGRIHDLRLSHYPRARENYLKAYTLYEELGWKVEMAQALLDAGRCFRLLGNFQEADKAYSDALAMLESPEPSLIRTGILMEKANNAWFQGRYQEAFDLQREVLDLARENGWPLEKAMALNTSGLTWWTLGDSERALRELQKALETSRTLKARRDETATALNNMGLVYRDMGEYQKALESLNQALAIDRDIKSEWAIAYDLKNLGITYVRMGQPEKALPLFEEAVKTAAHIGNRINEAKILVGYGEALFVLGRVEESETAFQKALALSRSMALRETQWRALYWLARLRLQQERKQEARDLLTEAMTIVEEMRAEIKVDQLKDGFITNKMAVYETLISLLLNMEPSAAFGSGRDPVEEAFDVAERSRARNLIDLLGNQRLQLNSAADQDLYDRQKALKARIQEQEMLLAAATAEAERIVYQQALDRLHDEYRDVMLSMQAGNPELAAIVSVNPIQLRQVQKLLEPGVSLLTYYTLPDEILCWVVAADSIRLFRTPLGRETLEKTVLDFRRMLQNLEPLEKTSKELHAWLLSKVLPDLAGSQVLGIVPHGMLHYLSFATLFDGKDYLADRFPLFYLPSASVLPYTLERRKDDKNREVLAIGNPDLNNPAMDLPFAEKEIFTIGWNFPEITLLTREKATESWVVNNISRFGIIHLASHGEFDPVNPLFSAVKLAPDRENDGNLEAAETFGLQIEADLVVLSACQTGLGKITSGDDVIGMNRSFLYAGTHAILSSLWRVSDITTAMLIKQFYRSYRTMNKADSLQKAMLHVKRLYPHPGYWGAFLLVGDFE